MGKHHGLSKTPEYGIWNGMKDRCLNPKNPGYKYYGGRGIKICKAWLRSFALFYRHMGPRPTPAHEIDRRNNDGNYTPRNCRWVTKDVNRRNKRFSDLGVRYYLSFTLNGKRQRQSFASKRQRHKFQMDLIERLTDEDWQSNSHFGVWQTKKLTPDQRSASARRAARARWAKAKGESDGSSKN